MKSRIKKLSTWKAIADLFLYLAVWGILSGKIGIDFYSMASWVILAGAVINIIFLIKQLSKRE